MIARRVLIGLAFLPLVTLLAPASSETPAERPRYKSPLGLAVDPTGQFAYVALHGANALAVVDLSKNNVLCEIAVGRKPYDVAFHKGIAYVTCEADDTLVAVDVAARKVERVFKVGQAPRGVSIDPYTELIQVVCHDEKVLWSRNYYGFIWQDPIPPQPEGNFARASNFELVFGKEATYRQAPRPFNLFTRGQSFVDPILAAMASTDLKKKLRPPRPPCRRSCRRTATCVGALYRWRPDRRREAEAIVACPARRRRVQSAFMSQVTQILSAIEQGDPQAAGQLLPLVYDELRRLAAQRLAQEKPGQTLQPTALVHEAYLRLVGADDGKAWDSQGHFFAAAAEAMRRILIDQARTKQSQRRGGGRQRVELEHVEVADPETASDVLALNEALERFEQIDHIKSELVKLRYFAGLSIPHAAQILDISSTTADRYWAYARAWLHAELRTDEADSVG